MIIITAGHTGPNSGAQGVEVRPNERFDEGKETIWLRDRLIHILTSCYGCVTLSDENDESLAVLTTRLNALVNEGDFCLDIHFNASKRRTAHGAEVIIADDANNESAMLALKLLNATASALQTDQRDIKREKQTPRRRLAMLHLNCPSAILEVCFCTNPSDVEHYFANRELLAQAIAQVLAENLLDKKPLCIKKIVDVCAQKTGCLIYAIHQPRRRQLYLVVLLLSLLGINSCQRRYSHSVHSSKESCFVQTIEPVTIAPDTALINALFKCDSLGNVYLNELNAYASKNMQMRYILDSGRFITQTIALHDTLYLPSVEKNVNIITTDTIVKTQIIRKPSAFARNTIIIETVILLMLFLCAFVWLIIKYAPRFIK